MGWEGRINNVENRGSDQEHDLKIFSLTYCIRCTGNCMCTHTKKTSIPLTFVSQCKTMTYTQFNLHKSDAVQSRNRSATNLIIPILTEIYIYALFHKLIQFPKVLQKCLTCLGQSKNEIHHRSPLFNHKSTLLFGAVTFRVWSKPLTSTHPLLPEGLALWRLLALCDSSSPLSPYGKPYSKQSGSSHLHTP